MNTRWNKDARDRIDIAVRAQSEDAQKRDSVVMSSISAGLNYMIVPIPYSDYRVQYVVFPLPTYGRQLMAEKGYLDIRDWINLLDQVRNFDPVVNRGHSDRADARAFMSDLERGVAVV